MLLSAELLAQLLLGVPVFTQQTERGVHEAEGLGEIIETATVTPNILSSGRDVPNKVSKRLRLAGFATVLIGDGVLAMKKTILGKP